MRATAAGLAAVTGTWRVPMHIAVIGTDFIGTIRGRRIRWRLVED